MNSAYTVELEVQITERILSSTLGNTSSKEKMVLQSLSLPISVGSSKLVSNQSAHKWLYLPRKLQIYPMCLHGLCTTCSFPRRILIILNRADAINAQNYSCFELLLPFCRLKCELLQCLVTSNLQTLTF